jgi:hypothetical protein
LTGKIALSLISDATIHFKFMTMKILMSIKSGFSGLLRHGRIIVSRLFHFSWSPFCCSWAGLASFGSIVIEKLMDGSMLM